VKHSGFSRVELDRFRGAYVDDLLGDDVRLLFVGINPGLWTAAVNAHFARPGNRFWPALYKAGITSTLVDARHGLADADLVMLRDAGVGITNLVPVATARADELTATELRAGADRLTALIEQIRPRVVAVLGITAYRQAFADKAVRQGKQTRIVGGSEVWVLPNPSGLNAHDTIDTLAVAYREADAAAGLVTP
jgi:TDG/mug DNA glycosylase family protein